MHANGQEWLVSWHGPNDEPVGARHVAQPACASARRTSSSWSAPTVGGGSCRPVAPEGEETLEETLRRELREEACVEVLTSAAARVHPRQVRAGS